jgi:hypothetical protein
MCLLLCTLVQSHSTWKLGTGWMRRASRPVKMVDRAWAEWAAFTSQAKNEAIIGGGGCSSSTLAEIRWKPAQCDCLKTGLKDGRARYEVFKLPGERPLLGQVIAHRCPNRFVEMEFRTAVAHQRPFVSRPISWIGLPDIRTSDKQRAESKACDSQISVRGHLSDLVCRGLSSHAPQ